MGFRAQILRMMRIMMTRIAMKMPICVMVVTVIWPCGRDSGVLQATVKINNVCADGMKTMAMVGIVATMMVSRLVLTTMALW